MTAGGARVVVVGAGFGGLAAAARLAAAGHEVIVLEKRDLIGGRAYWYDINGFRFDGGPTVLTAPFMFEELFALAGEKLSDHVELVPLDPFYRAFDASGGRFDFRASLNDFREEVARRSPADVTGFDRLQQKISGIFDAFYPYTERSMMQLHVMLRMLPYLLRHGAAQCGICIPGHVMTACALLERNPAPGDEEIRASADSVSAALLNRSFSSCSTRSRAVSSVAPNRWRSSIEPPTSASAANATPRPTIQTKRLQISRGIRVVVTVS